MGEFDLITPLVNAGGFAALSAVLLWLHIQTIAQFRMEMREERLAFAERNAAMIAAIERQTEKLSSQFAEVARELRSVDGKH